MSGVKKVRPKTICIVLICVLLALLTAFLNTAQVLAVAINPDSALPYNNGGQIKLYVSEVRLGVGETKAEAEKSLTDAGFVVATGNLNEGAGHYYGMPDGYCCLGYKYTTDRSRALTDLRAMDQDGGYKNFDYRAYAESMMPGLKGTAAEFKASCMELDQNCKAGKRNALLAKEFLNVFCVPATSDAKDGPALGDYLTDFEHRKDEDYEELLLILNTAVINIINAQLAIACTDGNLRETVIDGVGVTSHTGVVGVESFSDETLWLEATVQKYAKQYPNGNTAEKEIQTLTEQYYDQVYLLKNALNASSEDGGFSEKAIAYLKTCEVNYHFSADTQKIEYTGGETENLYEILSSMNDSSLLAFVSLLPKVCNGCHFTDVVEICAADVEHRLPEELILDYDYDVDWVRNVINSIDHCTFDPYVADAKNEHYTEVANYSDDISRFLSVNNRYFEQYEAEKKSIEENGVDLSRLTDTSEEEAEQALLDTVAGDKELEKSCDGTYLGTYEILKKYQLNSSHCGSMTTLAEYLYEIYRLNNSKDEKENWIAQALTYFIITALTPGQKYALKTSDLVTIYINLAMTDHSAASLAAQLPMRKAELLEGMDAERFSVWFGTNKDLLESESLAMTSDDVRRAIESKNFRKATSNAETDEDRYFARMIWFAVGASAALIGVIVFLGVAKFVTGLSFFFFLGHILEIAAIGSLFYGTVAVVTCLIGTVFLAVMVVAIFVMMIFYILWMIEQYSYKPPEYTAIPTVMLDCETDKNNNITNIVRYDVVRDQNGNPSDVNCNVAYHWNALYYTTDPNVGSPIVVSEGRPVFGIKFGETKKEDLSVPLAKFGHIDMFNMNTNCYEDEVDGIYVWFYTEASLNGESTDKPEGAYIKEITVAIAKTQEAARSYIQMMSGYYLFDKNLTPSNEDFYTYIGYSTTNNATEAVKDIRVVYGTTANEINYAGTSYINAFTGSMLTCPLKTCEAAVTSRTETPFSYSLFMAYRIGIGDESAPPILAGTFGTANSISGIPDDAEAVTMMSGGVYDFNSWDNEDYDTFSEHCFLYYKTEKPFKSTDAEGNPAKKYLAGLAFFSGSEDWLDSDDTSEYNVEKYAESLGYHIVNYDLTAGLLNNDEDVTYLAYAETYNPFRAITDLGVFTGEPGYGYLADNLISAGVGFEACNVYTQGDGNYYVGKGSQRLMRRSHAYFTPITGEGDCNGWDKDDVICARGLYMAGYQSGVRPLTIDDVVFSINSGVIPTAQGSTEGLYRLDGFNMYNYWNINNGKPVVGPLGTGWKTVHPLDRYYYDTYSASGDLTSCFNIGLGKCYDSTPRNALVMNLFVRNETIPNRVRGNYVATAQLVSSQEEHGSYDIARMLAMQMGTEIIGLESPIRLVSDEFPDLLVESPIYESDPVDYPGGCFLVSISYTDAESNALGDIRVLEQTEGNVLPSVIKMQLSDYNYTNYVKGNLAVLTAKSEYDEKDIFGRPLSEQEKAQKQKEKAGYVFYTTQNGVKINRLLIQQLRSDGVESATALWNENPDGVAEYYLRAGETSEPFCLSGYGNSLEHYFCARRYNTKETDDNYKYITDITFIRSDSFDGSIKKAVIRLGADGAPFAVNYDIFEGTIGSRGRSEAAVIGVTRSGSSKEAIKDIKISPDDLGPSFVYNDITYDRVNDEPLHTGILESEDIYIYITRETGGETIYVKEKLSWIDLYNDKTTDWANVDWRKIDLTTIVWSKFSEAIHTPLGSESWRTYIIATVGASDGLNAKDFAVTNFGLVPNVGDQTYWAGAGYSGNSKMLVPVTSGTPIFEAKAFNGYTCGMKLVYTNAIGENFDEKLEAYYRALDEALSKAPNRQSASIFADGATVWTVIAIGGIMAAALAATAIYSKKKKKTN